MKPTLPKLSAKEFHKDRRTYASGFILSLVLTIVPFGIVYFKTESSIVLYLSLAFFAVLQVFVQLTYFLHLGDEKRPRLNGLAFAFMLIIIGILMAGSLWIMYNMNYNMATPKQIQQQLKASSDL